MASAEKNTQMTRDSILMMLSDAEVAKVSTAEDAAAGVPDGDEYLDLEHIDRGIQKAKSISKAMMGHIIPRSAVSAATWSKITSAIQH